MSGKPQFDEPAVIAAAMEVFWRHGYAASSINQLTTATGLSRSSLYQRFTDKDGLFQEVLLAYTERVLRRMRAVQGKTKGEQLEALLLDFLRKEAMRTRPPGCLLTRSCAEMVDLPASSQAVAQDSLTRQRTVFVDILQAAVACAELPATVDIDALAWYYLGVLQAIMNLPQAGATAIELRRVINFAMLAWPSLRSCNIK